MSVAAIKKPDVQEWIRDLQDKGLAPATIRQCYRILGSVLEEAVDHRIRL